MNIELPENYDYRGQATVEDGILKVDSKVYWKKLAYEIAIAVKGKKCWYCGKELEDYEITIDHLYPQSLGGLTIPDNIAPSCGRCNNNKSNLTEFQYRHLLAAPSDEKGDIRRRFLARNHDKQIKKGFVLPKEWITHKRITNILVTMETDKAYPYRKYGKIEKFYRQYVRLPYPIIVDRKNYLLDGFLVLMFAKNNSISSIPVIELENVEYVFNTEQSG